MLASIMCCVAGAVLVAGAVAVCGGCCACVVLVGVAVAGGAVCVLDV